MKLFTKTILVSCFLTLLPFISRGIEKNEKEVPGGWELSGALALFRNLPLFDPGNFPATKGDVYFSHSDEAGTEGGSQVFKNTYRFYRESADGKTVELSVVEKHHISTVESSPSGALGTPSHKMSDLDRGLKVVPARPGNAKLHPELSKLLAFILDHRQALIDSEAGAMARELNYGTEGRIRTSDYVQPRVSFFEDSKGKVAQVQIHGLDSLLSSADSQGESVGKGKEKSVLQISVDDAGVAQVALTSPKSK